MDWFLLACLVLLTFYFELFGLSFLLPSLTSSFPPFLSFLTSFEIGNVTSPFLNYEMTQESRGRECPGVGMIGQCWLFKVSS